MGSDSDEDLKAAIALSLRTDNHVDLGRTPSRNGHSIPAPSDEESDEDLRIAIALSLEQASVEQHGLSKSKSSVIDLVSDDEDDDLDAPVISTNYNDELRKLDSGEHLEGLSFEAAAPPAAAQKFNVDSRNPTSELERPRMASPEFFALNRKQMEEERLARLSQKRKRIEDTEDESIHAHRPKLQKPTLNSASGYCMNELQDNKLHILSSRLQFPDGVVKRTWAFGTPRQPDDIKLEEVIQKSDLEFAVLSAFQIDPDWIASKLDPKTRVIWVLQAKTEAEKNNWRSQAPPNYRFCFPSMEGNINCMHSKLQLLAYPTHLRVVLPSANLTAYDWGETGVIENTCFIIDLPRLATKVKPEGLTGFGKELVYFLEAMGLEKPIVDSIRKFDFSRANEFAFVHSIGGNHTSDAFDRTGFCGLAKSVKSLGLATSSTIEVDFVASSIGSLKESFLESLYLAAQGNGWSEQESRSRKKCPEPSKKPETARHLADRFRIYFPTDQTVAESNGGYAAAGTICLSSKFYDAETFPRPLMRDCRSRRDGLLMHNKMMFVRSGASSWAYVGSANLSESAWGRVVKDRTTKEFRLNLRNWECGVIFPVQVAGRFGIQTAEAGQGIPGWDVFKNRVPIPMLVLEADGGGCLEHGNRRPWFFG